MNVQNSQISTRLLTISEVCERTSLSRSMIYREFYNLRGKDGKIRYNPAGRLKATHIGKSIRVKERDLANFIEQL